MVEDPLSEAKFELAERRFKFAKEVEGRMAKRAKKEDIFRGLEAVERAPKITKSIFVLIGFVLVALFVISPAALGFLQILSQIPEWLMYAIIGMFILIFLLKRRK